MQGTVCPYKRTDYRYDIWKMERKTLRAKAKKNKFRVEIGPQPRNRSAVTVDTSHAKSTVDVVRLCLRDLGWREYPYGKRDGGSCDIYWNSVQYSENPDLPGGKVNKFPGMVEVVRKVNLGRTLDLMHSLYPDEYDFHPQSWFLPQQFPEFCDSYRRFQERKQRRTFIVKPDEGSQGDGIYLITEPKDYMFTDKHHVVQEYVANVLLLESLKFDFRVYVVIASLEPLEVYICKEGLARFCTQPYEQPTNRNIHEAYMHLTNYSLNKRSSGYLHTESEDDGSKRTMTSVFRRLDLMGYDVKRIWSNVQRLVVKTMVAIAPELKVEYHAELPPWKSGASCYQILGFDILLEGDGKPILLEVNANPSLRLDYEHEMAPGISEYIHSPVDEEIKRPLVMDTLILVAPRHKMAARHDRAKSAGAALTLTAATRGVDLRAKAESEDEAEIEPVVLQHKGYGSLEQIYPRRYGTECDWLRILDRTADIFLDCLGIRGALRMGATGFRTFTRKCRLTCSGTGFTNASMDILYIDLQRRWEHVNPGRTSGLCFQGFVESFFIIAKKKFPGDTIVESVENLLDYCEASIEFSADPRNRDREPMFPKLKSSDKKQEELKLIYGSSGRKKIGNSYHLDYKNFAVQQEQQQQQRKPVRMKTFMITAKDIKSSSARSKSRNVSVSDSA